MTTGDIQSHLAEIYGAEVSRDLISKVTDAVLGDLVEWQNRPLDAVYPVVLIDCIEVKICDDVQNRPSYVAMGIKLDGQRDVLDTWVGPTGGEGAKHWLARAPQRAVLDVCIVVATGCEACPTPSPPPGPRRSSKRVLCTWCAYSMREAAKAHCVTNDMRAIYTLRLRRAPSPASASSRRHWPSVTRP